MSRGFITVNVGDCNDCKINININTYNINIDIHFCSFEHFILCFSRIRTFNFFVRTLLY
jgi:hypothetical protein